MKAKYSQAAVRDSRWFRTVGSKSNPSHGEGSTEVWWESCTTHKPSETPARKSLPIKVESIQNTYLRRTNLTFRNIWNGVSHHQGIKFFVVTLIFTDVNLAGKDFH